MGLENCQIYLDNPTATYCPGDTINGRVEFNFNSVRKVRGIEVKFVGKGTTRWTESEPDISGDKYRFVSYSASEEYYNKKYYLIGGKNNESIEIQPGHHVYQFSYQLSPVLPSSFESDCGKVRYTVTVTLVRPWKFNQSLKSAYTIVEHLDVNKNPKWREPATRHMKKDFWSLFGKSGPLAGIIKVPYTGFVSGQVIPITLEIYNGSNVSVLKIKIKLNQIVTYHSSRPMHKTKISVNTIAEVLTNIQVPKKTANVFKQFITIPSIPPSNLSHCRSIIDIAYEIRVTAVVNGLHKNMVGNLPLIIGTIPLLCAVPKHLIPSMPPPSYKECMFGATTILEDDDSKYTKLSIDKWAPSYPVYHFLMNPNAPSASGAPTATPKM